MSWRTVVVTGMAKLDLKIGFLVVRKETTTRIHLSEIHTLIVESTAVSLTAALLNELVHKKIKVIFCDEQHNPASELIPCYGSHDSSLKIGLQISWPNHIKEAVWTEIVAEKIRKQRNLLRKYELSAAVELLDGYLSQLQPGDVTNREGHAAKVYFNALFGMQFTRSEECAVNAALNYGYALLLSAFNREIVANGYLTQLGLSQGNRFNAFNLACDFMEPFRPLVDQEVKDNSFQTFEREEKTQMIDLLNCKIRIANTEQRLTQGIRIYCKSVLDALNHQDIGLLHFYHDL